MSLFIFLTVVQAIVATLLVTVILMQKSEGGGLGVGGSPTGLMSARGAGNFMTRTTTILASIFILLSIALAALATVSRKPDTIDASLARPATPAPDAAPAQNAPVPLAVPGQSDSAPADKKN